MTREEFSFRIGKLMFLEALLGKLDMEVEDAGIHTGESGTDTESENPEPFSGHNGGHVRDRECSKTLAGN
jgi:hypothetical protein